MRLVLSIALGIVAAIGGYLDIGDLVFNVQAGSSYAYGLLWAVVIGVIGIMVYAEMCGRIVAVTGRPVFDVIRQRLGFGAGLVALIASEVINLLTIAAEIGGVAIVLQLLFDAPFSLFVVVGTIGLVAVVAALPFGALERFFGYGGLLLLVFVVAGVHLEPDWSALAKGFVPELHADPLYLYFVVGVASAALMPYEVHFYSSGGVEEGWTADNLRENRLNVLAGYGIGSTLAIALMVVAAEVLRPAGVDPSTLGTVVLPAQTAFGELGLLAALLGVLFAVGGAAMDVSFAGAYDLAQFVGWQWGREAGPSRAPRFFGAWLFMLAAGVLIVLSGVNPVDITEYAVVFSVVALPLTYFPLLLVAGDRSFMGDHVNGPFARTLGWLYFAVVLVLAVVAVPLLLITNGGGG